MRNRWPICMSKLSKMEINHREKSIKDLKMYAKQRFSIITVISIRAMAFY